MPEQHLDVHELGSGLQEPGRVGVPELVGGDRLIDACPSEEPPQVGPHHVGHRRLTAGLLGEYEVLLALIAQPEPKYLAEGLGQRHHALPIPLTDHSHTSSHAIHYPHVPNPDRA
jgi:hypothetical protein